MKNTKLTTLIRTTSILNLDGNITVSTNQPLRIGVFKTNNFAPHVDFFATFEDQINCRAFYAISEDGHIPEFVIADSQKIAITGTLRDAFKRQPIQDPR